MSMHPLAVVVGAGSGMGMALARRFGTGGHRVALVARRADRLDEAVAALAAEGVTAYAAPADASDADDLRRALDGIRDVLGEPSVLLYNASASVEAPPTELDPEAFLATLRVNAVAPLVAAQCVAPAMRAAGSGTILLTGGGTAVSPAMRWAALSAGKAAMRSLAYTLSEELRPAGIHVATVTIRGIIGPGTHFDPDRIAEVFWEVHRETAGSWRAEVDYV